MQHQDTYQTKAQIAYFSQGGGPLPVLGDTSHKAMMDFMRQLPLQIRRPSVILVISAHWEEDAATLSGAQNPPMDYDYYGFPDEAYSVQYPAPGNPEPASRIAGILEKSGLPSRIDTQRGYEHGLFISLKLMYPNADVPAIQLWLIKGLSATIHIALGKALRELMQESILIIGSGFSFHNMQSSAWDGSRTPVPENDVFQNWLIDVSTVEIPKSEREQHLIEWAKAPLARYCHSRKEHLLLLVCSRMADQPGSLMFDDYILGKRAGADLAVRARKLGLDSYIAQSTG